MSSKLINFLSLIVVYHLLCKISVRHGYFIFRIIFASPPLTDIGILFSNILILLSYASGEMHEELLRKYFKLENGIPSHDTFQKVMGII